MELTGFDLVRPLVQDGAYVVVRARRAADRRVVLLESVTGAWGRGVSGDHALDRERARLAPLAGEPSLLVPDAIDEQPAGRFAMVPDHGLAPAGSLLEDALLSIDAAFAVLAGVAAGLGLLHRHGIVHGAVSPQTIWTDATASAVRIGGFCHPARAGLDPASPPTLLTLACQAPEQSGRLDRVPDERTDFYGLGATAYWLIGGRPPFPSDDRLEVMHGHLARRPVPLTGIRPEVPAALAGIVAKLLAKSPDERYQSAEGLSRDLGRAAAEWRAGRPDAVFPLGAHDRSERFVTARRLYGRERELGVLQDAFERTCGGETGLVLVAGYSGIGKTSLIHELQVPFVRRGACFIAGKFDQIARDIPYGALIQAWRSLARQLLAESDSRLEATRTRLQQALGAHAGILSAAIPELQPLLGAAEPPPGATADAQRRFAFALQTFLATVAQPERPLVIVLDDLQWADAASLDLLQELLTSAAIRYLLVIGSYRDNEVDATHLLTWALDRLQATGARIERLALTPLGRPDLVRFLEDSLGGPAERVAPLAAMLERKTDGNPFFAIEFLHSLARAGLLRLDREAGVWTFDLDAIAAARGTGNVAELVSRRVHALSLRGQRVATLAACLGDPFTRRTLLAVSSTAAEDVAAGVDEAVGAGLVVPEAGYHADAVEGAFRFLHDRVQLTAYGLIPEARRAALHLHIGQRLLDLHAGTPPDAQVFAVVRHLTIGAALIEARGLRLELARLNLRAGRLARAAAAYREAAAYFQAGVDVAGDAGWEEDQGLALALHVEAAECRYLTGELEDAERRFDRLLDRTTTRLQRAELQRLRAVLAENQARYPDAVAVTLDALRSFGERFPEDEPACAAALESTIGAIDARLGGRSIAALVDLPGTPGDDQVMVLKLLATLWSSSYMTGRHALTRLISARMVALSLAHGNTAVSAYGYVTHAITIGPVRGDYRQAYEWGRLALAIDERFGDVAMRAKIHQQFHAHVQLWCRPFAECVPHARQALAAGLESGDFMYAAYGALTETWPAWLAATRIDPFVREYESRPALLDRLRMPVLGVGAAIMTAWARALQGRTRDPQSLGCDSFDEDAFMATHAANPFLSTLYQTARLHLALVAEDAAAAETAATAIAAAPLSGTVWPVMAAAWAALATSRGAADEVTRGIARKHLAAADAWLEPLAETAGDNFQVLALLVRAERARLDGRADEARTLCEQAARCARDFDQPQQEALAAEVAAALARDTGDRDGFAAALRTARRAWRRWGAAARVEALERAHPGMLAPQGSRAAEAAPAATAPVSGVDLETVLRVARVMAGQTELDALLRELMRLAIESGGAQRGAFVRAEDGVLMLEAEAEASDDGLRTARRSQPIDTVQTLPLAFVRYVARTLEDAVVVDASVDERFAADPYVVRVEARSMLGLPVSHQGRFGGILYLENHLARGVFTPARLEVLRVLASQAAIALENARLYEEMREEVRRRSLAETALQTAMTELEALKDRLEAENVYLQEEIRTEHNFEEIVGNSPALLEALRRVERVAATDSTVLILGETGTGKELFARAIHSHSGRRHRPLVKVNCGAIAPGLVESELFGHVKGAFTGAIDTRLGRFEIANGGTIFLDEVGELRPEAQVKLLRVLQEHEFEPVGSSRTVRVNVRVIAATNRNLEDAVRQGTFRSDLLYRLNVVPVTVPPLRARTSDIPLLIAFFVNGLARRLGKPLHGFTASSMDRLVTYGWPGNVRELQNVVERAAILAAGPVLTLEGEPEAVAAGGAVDVEGVTLEALQRAHIVRILESTGGVVEGVRGAATILGLHPNTLRSRMKRLGIEARKR